MVDDMFFFPALFSLTAQVIGPDKQTNKLIEDDKFSLCFRFFTLLLFYDFFFYKIWIYSRYIVGFFFFI